MPADEPAEIFLKVCPRCRTEKLSTDFTMCRTKGTDGLQGWCKACHSLYARCWRYGVTIDQWLDMALAQRMRCACCGIRFRAQRDMCMDHDHSCCNTGKNDKTCGKCNRAILCQDCNKAMGWFEKPGFAKMIGAYLARFQPEDHECP